MILLLLKQMELANPDRQDTVWSQPPNMQAWVRESGGNIILRRKQTACRGFRRAQSRRFFPLSGRRGNVSMTELDRMSSASSQNDAVSTPAYITMLRIAYPKHPLLRAEVCLWVYGYQARGREDAVARSFRNNSVQ